MDSKRLDRQLQAYVDEKVIAGGILLVRKNGALIYRKSVGYADLEKQTEIDENTIFRLASMTKPVTAVAILQLMERGMLQLDDPVSRFIPEFEHLSVCSAQGLMEQRYVPDPEAPAGHHFHVYEDVPTEKAKRIPTIRDLLTHSGGFGMGPVGMGKAAALDRERTNLGERIRRYKDVPLDFQPGEMTGYSAIIGFDILGRVVEIASGASLDAYFRKYIFEPLDMRDTAFALSPEQKKRLAVLYRSENHSLRREVSHEDLLPVPDAAARKDFAGSSGLYGSMGDYDRFVGMLFEYGAWKNRRILKEETVALMNREGAVRHLELEPGSVWGLGILIRNNRLFGWSGAYGTHYVIDNFNRMQVVFGTNCSNIGGAASPVSKRLEELILTET